MNGKIIRTSLLAVGGSLLALVLLIIAVSALGPLYNDSVLNSFSQQLYNCSLPEETVLVEKHKICGKLNGNGDGMDFLACILIKSEKTINELEKHFESLEFKGAKTSSKMAEIQILTVMEPELKTEYLENGEITFSLINSSDQKYYAIVIYDGGYWNFFDGRGA
jgi:hypothetical protein